MKRNAGVEHEPVRIAIRGGQTWTVDDWKQIDFTSEEGWQQAIEIFEDRMCGRFFDLIERIEKVQGAGFAVMALDCLLIETLQQFREGVDQTPERQTGLYFQKFLTETAFGGENGFDEKKAPLFYQSIRNGILHMAEIKGSSRILTRGGVPLVDYIGLEGLIINRVEFHKRLKQCFYNYLVDLRKSDPPDIVLRENFRKKMNFICRKGDTS